MSVQPRGSPESGGASHGFDEGCSEFWGRNSGGFSLERLRSSGKSAEMSMSEMCKAPQMNKNYIKCVQLETATKYDTTSYRQLFGICSAHPFVGPWHLFGASLGGKIAGGSQTCFSHLFLSRSLFQCDSQSCTIFGHKKFGLLWKETTADPNIYIYIYSCVRFQFFPSHFRDAFCKETTADPFWFNPIPKCTCTVPGRSASLHQRGWIPKKSRNLSKERCDNNW